MDALFFSMSVTAPIILMLLLGQILYRCKMLSEAFVKQGSTFIFKICLPLLIFFKMSETNFSEMQGPLDTILIVQAILAGFALLIWLISAKIPPQQRGVFVQGSFHGNTIIIGLALVQNNYGERANTLTSLYIALSTIFVNIQSILVLDAAYLQQLRYGTATTVSERYSKRLCSYCLLFCKIFLQNGSNIIRNPLIVASCLGLLYSFFKLPSLAAGSPVKPYLQWLSVSGNYLAEMTLPLALMCIGAKLRLSCLQQQKRLLLLVSFLKLMLLPLCALTILIFLKVVDSQDSLTLGVIFLMLSCPAATTSFVLAEQMHGDGELAANIIASSTIFSIFTTTIALLFLRLLNIV